LAACAASAWAQQIPGAPEDNGLTPKTDTIYINRQTADLMTINNGGSESLGVAVANGGNVLVGWEDDGSDGLDSGKADGLQDLEAVWTMFDSGGVWITPMTTITALELPGQSLTNQFLSYFRSDGSATPGGTSWGAKIHANLFGDGLGMGASSFLLGEEVKEFAAYDDSNQGDFPSVQLLNNDDTPGKIVAGVSSAYATSDSGNIRIADWEYLSNGNVVVVDESRQDQDLINLYGGTDAKHHAIFRIVDPTGKVVKAETLVSQTPIESQIWHGAAVTANGFAVRFAGPTATVRMFDNGGNPTSTNIDLAATTGHPEAGEGGRGDGAGFHGNGKDAYVHVAGSSDHVWVTVLSTNGTVKFSKTVADDLTLNSVGRADAAIDPDGNVIVVFEAKYNTDNPTLIMGRRFDATGKPIGGTFYVSEVEMPGSMANPSSGPRVAWRSGEAAVVWQSKSDTGTVDPTTGSPKTVVALRLFSTFTPGTVEGAGLTRLVPDTPVVKTTLASLGNWEPYASVLGNSVFLVEGNTFAEGTTDSQRFVVRLQPADGKAPGTTVEGFYSDDGKPYTGVINASRQNGNPGRVAGDKRPGAVNYMVGAEASPHTVSPQFTSDNRWNLGFDRLSDGRYGTVQTYKLDIGSLTPTPLMKAVDSANGRATTGEPAGNQITRFGGEIACLDNGNFVSVVEDRGHTRSDVDCVTATIFAADGSIVKDSWVVVNSDIWSNVAAYKGGFAIRAKPADGSNTRIIYFHDNAGNLLGKVDQITSGASYDTGRGDGTRIFSHINSPYVYLVGKDTTTTIVKVSVFDSRTQKFVAIADISEGGFTGSFDRAFGAVDALDRMTIGWVVQPAGYAQQQVAARVLALDAAAKKITPLTSSFFPFINHATNSIRTLQMSVAMTTKQICVAAKGEISYENTPAAGPDSPTEVNFYTVFTHPAPKDDPTPPAGSSGSPTLSVAMQSGQVVITWSSGTLVSSPTVKGTYNTVPNATSPYKVTPTGSALFFQTKQ
jgi:hypothetical protein